MTSTVKIHNDAGIIDIDNVSFCPKKISDIRVDGGHPQGPVFCCDSAKAIISPEDAELLVKAGVTDNRKSK